MTTDKNYMPISVGTGAVIGAAYGFRNPSEKVCKKLAQKPTIVDTMKGYFDCFNIKEACEAVRGKQLTSDEFEKANNIRKAIYNTYQKEKQIVDIMNQSILERPMTFKQALKEANKTRLPLYKEMFCFNNEFKQKLVELNIFDAEKFSKVLEAAVNKTMLTYKELSKGALKGLSIGALIGVGIGAFLNNISHKA